MAHKTYDELQELIEIGKTKINVGDHYVHYKDPSVVYEIKDIILIESTEDIGVVYSPIANAAIKWMRPLEEFLEEIKTGGKTVSRFSKV